MLQRVLLSMEKRPPICVIIVFVGKEAKEMNPISDTLLRRFALLVLLKKAACFARVPLITDCNLFGELAL